MPLVKYGEAKEGDLTIPFILRIDRISPLLPFIVHTVLEHRRLKHRRLSAIINLIQSTELHMHVEKHHGVGLQF